jgi:hypothetical protein
MSTFSVTSPRITLEAEARERESLTAQELDELEQDVNGNSIVFTETDAMRRQAISQLEEAIEMIPDLDKVDIFGLWKCLPSSCYERRLRSYFCVQKNSTHW